MLFIKRQQYISPIWAYKLLHKIWQYVDIDINDIDINDVVFPVAYEMKKDYILITL